MVSEVKGQCRWINSSIIVIGKWIWLFCVTVLEQIVHLRTPKESTVGKVMDSCIKMLGVTEDKRLFIMTETQGAKNALAPLGLDREHNNTLDLLLPAGSPQTLPSDQLIGSLLKSDNKQLELHLCKIVRHIIWHLCWTYLELRDLKRQTQCFSFFFFFIQEKPISTVSHADPEVKGSGQNSSNASKEERIRELNQQVDSLQNAIRQVRIPLDH